MRSLVRNHRIVRIRRGTEEESHGLRLRECERGIPTPTLTLVSEGRAASERGRAFRELGAS